MKRHLPNAITCLNLLCGCLALTFIFGSDSVTGAYFVGLAAVADFFDGLVARALRVSSPIGKDLDSLADMVSFGVVPGAILYQLLLAATLRHDVSGALTATGHAPTEYLALGGFVVTVFSALRLAKFNNDTRQSDSFIGLPTPACTLVVASLPLVIAHETARHPNATTWLGQLLLNPVFLLALAVLLSGLLVAELPLFALKFKNLKWLGNRRRFLFVALALGLVLGLGAAGVPLAVLAYVLFSIPKSRAVKPVVRG